MVNTRKVLFLTSTRADFGKLKPLMQVVDNSPDFECQIFVTGMHTLSLYGYTVEEVIKTGFKNVHVYMNQVLGEPMDLILANTINGFSRYVHEIKPDIIVVHGDRAEAMAGAIVGALNNILVAHIEGGELSGTVDELIRHSVSKLAHVHFVANEEAAFRLRQLGESEDVIFIIGSPDIDVMLSNDLPDITEVKRRYEINFKEFGVVLYHSVTTELEGIAYQAEQFVEALVQSRLKYVVIYPNNDPGTKDILKAYKKLENNNNFKVFPSMRFEYFLTLLKHSKFIIGNSSAGIREAPVYGVPTINIGSRQKNRFNYKTIINVDYSVESILKGISTIKNLSRETPIYKFGNGQSASLFLNHLKQNSFWKIPTQKQFRDFYKYKGMMPFE